MRYAFITAQLLRQARAAASIETMTRPTPSIIHGRRVSRLVAWGAVILVVAAVAALGLVVPAGPAHAYVPDERAKHVAERTLAPERHIYSAAPNQAAQTSQPTDAVERFRSGERASQEQPATAQEHQGPRADPVEGQVGCGQEQWRRDRRSPA